jgi:small GTP-binding protein
VPTKSGWLTKQGAVRKNWKRRWFTCRDGAVAYYAAAPDASGKFSKEPKGEFPLTDAIVRSCQARVGKQHALEVITRARTYFLVAADDAEMEAWIDVLQRNVTTVRTAAANAAGGMISPGEYVGSKEVFIKVLVIGDSTVGKTQLVRRWDGESFQKKYVETEQPPPFLRNKEPFDGWTANICVYDVPGSVRMLDSLWRSTAAVIVCFDVTNQTSFGKAKRMCREVCDNVERCVPILVGTKGDLDHVVDQDAASTFAHEQGGVYVLTSAKDNRDCDQPFAQVLRAMSAMDRWAGLPVSPDAVL